MKPMAKYAAALLLAAGLGHMATLWAMPRVIMRTVMGKMSDDGAKLNQFTFGDRTTQASRRVVRPSPDLAYSQCVYDLSGGALLVTAAPSPNQGYVSLSVFDARTDNIAVFDTTQYPQGISFVLAREGQVVPAGAQVVRARFDRGVILDRRLAPSAELFAEVDKARRADSCARAKI